MVAVAWEADSSGGGSMGSRISLVLIAWVMLAASPALASPLVLPEVGAGDPPWFSARDTQENAVVAGGPNGFLAVWPDYRGQALGEFGHRIYAARIDPVAGVVDRAGIRVSPPQNDDIYPSVAAGGPNWLVVWVNRNTGLLAARIRDADGALLDQNPIAIALDQPVGGAAVAFDGNNFLVAWPRQVNNKYQAVGVRIRGDGVVLDAKPLVLTNAPAGTGLLTLAFGSGVYLLAWSDGRLFNITGTDVWAERIKPDGTVLDVNGFVVSDW